MEKAPKARVPDLDKRKYLVPSDLTGNGLSFWPFIPGKAVLICISRLKLVTKWVVTTHDFFRELANVARHSLSFHFQFCVVFPSTLPMCLTHGDTAKQHAGVKKQLSVIYTTLKLSHGDPEVDLFQSQHSVFGGSRFRDSYLNALSLSRVSVWEIKNYRP